MGAIQVLVEASVGRCLEDVEHHSESGSWRGRVEGSQGAAAEAETENGTGNGTERQGVTTGVVQGSGEACAGRQWVDALESGEALTRPMGRCWMLADKANLELAERNLVAIYLSIVALRDATDALRAAKEALIWGAIWVCCS